MLCIVRREQHGGYARKKRGKPREGFKAFDTRRSRAGAPVGPAPGAAGPNSVGKSRCFTSLGGYGGLVVRSSSRRKNMRKKRDKQRSQPPWYVQPLVFRIIGWLARVIINIIDS